MAAPGKMEVDGEDIFSRLPTGCIARILSLTSPLDAVRSALEFKAFKSESESDEVWGRFLPPDWKDIMSRSVKPVDFSSKKELYFRLCDSILIDGGKMIFSVDKRTGKKCFMLSARELKIVWGDDLRYWRWNPDPLSRFAEVAVLRMVCWLEIQGLFGSNVLSPNTTYTAYLVVGYEGAYGLDHPPAVVSVRLGNQGSEHNAYLQSMEQGSAADDAWIPDEIELGEFYRDEGDEGEVLEHNDHLQSMEQGNAADVARIPQRRSDDWFEIELGEFHLDEEDGGEVQMSLMGMQGGHWKGGLIIEGIEIRPKGSPIV